MNEELVELSNEELELVAGGYYDSDCCGGGGGGSYTKGKEEGGWT